MKKAITTFAVLALIAIPLFGGVVMAVEKDKEQIEELEARIQKLEMQNAKDRIQFTGDLRTTADNISATLAPRVDGLKLQKGMVDTLFYAGANMGAFPMSYGDVSNFIAANYADYLYFQNGLNFDWLKNQVNGIASQPGGDMMIAGLFGMLMDPAAGVPGIMVPEQDYKNDLVYTTRLRLNMNAKVKENVTFTGRLGMYKSWGDSTGVQVFNGQTNTFSLDGSDVGVPNSDILRVERAYFDWKHLGGSDWYLSIGRRPSTYGPPLQVSDNELRQGTPNGHVVNFQFDGITLGRAVGWSPGSTFRFCYGVGFEAGIGSGAELKAPADRMDDVILGGINWDIYHTDDMFIQTTILGAWDVTDGFNGTLVLPTDPVSGNPINAPVVLRYTPSAHVGDIYLADFLVERNEGPFTWFASLGLMTSEPDPEVTTPFGGLFSDPLLDTPESRDAWSAFAGIRFNASDSDMLGLEFNHGSKYWFNFTQAADDLVGSKLATRGDVIEAYWLHEFKEGFGRARLKFRLGAMHYSYNYTGSGWQLGAPKKIDDLMPVISAFPTYGDALDIRAAITAKF
ncbi:MAG: DUF3373 family protein [Acidobacteria bacterium]|uniref:DUF3373 family protein n=1 Tax=Candidatus Polarisedimenticola svalbardensis TaxID=2886004 RepID=A0A8J7C1Q9_9BACT|nr:DUF3373 family protein [Candidatus Polarisedimenticola svalbardensis]